MQLNTITILGVKMIDQQSVGILIGTKSRSTISEWLARAGLDGISIRNKKWYSQELIKDYLRYERVDVRQAVEILREIKILQEKKKEGGKENGKDFNRFD